MIKGIEKFGNRWWGALILISLPLFIVLSPTLIGGYDFIEPENERFQQFFYFYKDAISNGESIFWNPYLFSGFPTFTSLTGGFLNPVIYLGMKFLSVSLVYNWMNFLYFALAGFFMFRLLKKINISFWGSLAGGIIYPFSQWSQNHDISVSSNLFFLPLFFLIVLRAKDGGRWNFLLGSLIGSAGAAMVWFSSHWHFMVEITFAAFLFSIFLAIGIFLKDKAAAGKSVNELLKIGLKKYAKAPLFFLAISAGGVIFGIFQLIPTYVFIKLSVRSEQIASHLAATQAGVGFRDIIGFFLPYFNYPLSALSSYYVDYWGILPLFLFLLIFEIKFFKNIFSNNEKVSYISFFSFLFLLSLIVALKYSPLFWLMNHLPVFDLLHETSRWMLLTSFSLAALSGFGLDAVLKNTEELNKNRRFKIALDAIKWSGVFFAIASLVSFVFLYVIKNKVLGYINDYFDKKIYSDEKFFSLKHYHDYISGLFYDFFNSFNLFNLEFLIPFTFLTAGYFTVRYLFKHDFAPKTIGFFVTLFIVLNFTAAYFINGNIAPRRPIYSETETVKFMKEKGDGRIFSFLRFLALNQINGDKDYSKNRTILKKDLLYPNKNLVFDIETIDYEGDPMVNKNMAKFVSYVGGVANFKEDGTKNLEDLNMSVQDKTEIFLSRKPIIDFLGVRYILSPGSLDENIFAKIFESKSSVKEIPIIVYENEQYRPLYYFTDEKWLINMPKNTKPEDLNILLKNSKDGIIQKGLKLIERKNSLLVIYAYTDLPRFLVFSQNNLPGWEVSIDGIKSEMLDVGTIYMGVTVPEGGHRIKFEYKYWNIWKHFLSSIN